jgi:hypothetical protein
MNLLVFNVFSLLELDILLQYVIIVNANEVFAKSSSDSTSLTGTASIFYKTAGGALASQIQGQRNAASVVASQ